jgi:hypothetical protein
MAAVAALLVASVIASSSAHAMLLGDAVVRSAPGAPLRVVIPLKPTPGEALEAACFRMISSAESEAAMVTARVSLERAAATPRLIITTPNAVGSPTVRFSIEAGCDGTIRRNYALVLDPRGAKTVRTPSSASASAAEPGQEPLDAVPRVAGSTADPRSSEAPRPATTGAIVASSAGTPRLATPIAAPAAARRMPVQAPSKATSFASDESDALLWYLGAPLGMGIIALGVLFATRRHVGPSLPDWTRGSPHSGPRSRTDMSAQPVTLSRFDPTPMPELTTRQRPDGASLRVFPTGLAANSLRRKPGSDVSTLDTLINEASEADKLEERAVREAWAAARVAVEKEEDNAILRAIDDAERELLFVPPPPKEAAMDRSLEDDLLSQPRRPKKAAA